MKRRLRPRPATGVVALVASVLLAAGCGGTEQGSAPAPAATIEIPPDWVAVTTVDGAMELTLPPWLIVSDTKNSIRAESLPMAPGQDSEFRVFAVEPGMTIGLAEPLRLPGEDLEAWLRRQLGGEPSAVARMTTVTLPAGTAARYEDVEEAGTPAETRFIAFAVNRPTGVALLLIAGPAAAWPAREAQIELIPSLLWIR